MDKIQRGSKRDFFISQNMIFDLDISIYAKMTYMYLCRLADNDNQSFPSYNTIAKACSYSKSSAIRSIQELEKIGLIEKKSRNIKKDGKIINRSNIYFLYDKPKINKNKMYGDGELNIVENEEIKCENCDTQTISSSVCEEPLDIVVIDDDIAMNFDDSEPNCNNGGSVSVTPGVVSERHQGSIRETPYKYPIKNTSIINNLSILSYLDNTSINNLTKFIYITQGISMSKDEMDKIDKKEISKLINSLDKKEVYSLVKHLTSYDKLIEFYKDNEEMEILFKSFINIIIDLWFNGIEINGEKQDLNEARSKILNLTQDKIQYIYEYYSKYSDGVKNPVWYIKSMIWNLDKTYHITRYSHIGFINFKNKKISKHSTYVQKNKYSDLYE